MKKFRILHTESSHGLGGEEYRVLSEAKAMGLRGHQVVIAAPGKVSWPDWRSKKAFIVKPFLWG